MKTIKTFNQSGRELLGKMIKEHVARFAILTHYLPSMQDSLEQLRGQHRFNGFVMKNYNGELESEIEVLELKVRMCELEIEEAVLKIEQAIGADYRFELAAA